MVAHVLGVPLELGKVGRYAIAQQPAQSLDRSRDSFVVFPFSASHQFSINSQLLLSRFMAQIGTYRTIGGLGAVYRASPKAANSSRRSFWARCVGSPRTQSGFSFRDFGHHIRQESIVLWDSIH